MRRAVNGASWSRTAGVEIIGKETGELEKMLAKIADFYEDEVDASIQTLTSIIEPLMMIGVGIMVGVIGRTVLTWIWKRS